MKSISLINISFAHDGGDELFHDLNITFHNNQTIAIVGDNGVGKSSLLKIITGELLPDTGHVSRNATFAYMPQIGNHGILSGGQYQTQQIARVFDANTDIVILDEPTNNLDANARKYLMERLARFSGGAIIVSHDRELLRRVDIIMEISGGKINIYGGGYEFYVTTRNAMRMNLESKYTDTQKRIKELNRTLNVAQNTRQHHEAKQEKETANARRSRIAANALKGKSQETEARLRKHIQRKIDEQIAQQKILSEQLRDDTIKIPMPHKKTWGKELVRINNLTFGYDDRKLIQKLNFTIYGGQKIQIIGQNGAGKSTLLKLICGQLQPDAGTVATCGKIAYLNQDLSLLNTDKSIIDNITDIAEILPHDAHAIAANFGFRGDASRRIVRTLSGGELLRATLAAILGSANQPDLLILDEPTNNLDMRSTDVFINALQQYNGALLLVSHDMDFVNQIGIETTLDLRPEFYLSGNK